MTARRPSFAGRWVSAAAILVLLSACGGGSGKPATKAAWERRHGATVRSVNAALANVQAATHDGEPVAIRTNCEALRDSLKEARTTLPVPDKAANTALRKALDGMDAGVADCLGAMAKGDARQLERSITELHDARVQLDTANAELAR